MKNHHEEIINAHLKNENHEEFLRKDYRQNMLEKIESSTDECQKRRKMIASTRGSLHVTDDKTQCII
jgi:hypothetical protein